MWRQYFNLTTFTLFLLILFIVLLVITITKGFDWWVQIIALVIKNLSGLDYQLYDDAYTDGLRSGGVVLKQIENVKTRLACGNLMHATKNAVAANYVLEAQSCTLLGSILPLSDDEKTTFIVPATASTDSSILKWLEPEESIASPGVLYCSNAFANSSHARAICASLPECAAFTYEYTPLTQTPRGCLKMASAAMYTSADTSTYSGPRNNLVTYNDATSSVNSPPPYYRFGTSMTGASIAAVVLGQSLSQCGTLLETSKTTTPAATWDASATGTCTLFGTFDPTLVVEDFDGATKNLTLLLSSSLPQKTIQLMSNVWTHQPNMDTPNTNATIGQGQDITPRQAQLLCAQTSGCVGFVQRSDARWYMLSDVSAAASTQGSDMYTIPPSFIG